MVVLLLLLMMMMMMIIMMMMMMLGTSGRRFPFLIWEVVEGVGVVSELRLGVGCGWESR